MSHFTIKWEKASSHRTNWQGQVGITWPWEPIYRIPKQQSHLGTLIWYPKWLNLTKNQNW